MRSVDRHDAQEQLPQLLQEVAAGETIALTDHGHEVAMLVPPATRRRRRAMGDATVQLRTLGRRRDEEQD